MYVLVCGSRRFTNAQMVYGHLEEMHELECFDKIITGGAHGPDSFAHEWACGYNDDPRNSPIEALVMNADWATHGKSAGFKRNIAMLDTGVSHVVAFWDGESRGTLHTIQAAHKRGLWVRIIR